MDFCSSFELFIKEHSIFMYRGQTILKRSKQFLVIANSIELNVDLLVSIFIYHPNVIFCHFNISRHPILPKITVGVSQKTSYFTSLVFERSNGLRKVLKTAMTT